MSKMTDSEIEQMITQCHANVLAVVHVTRDQRQIDSAARRELRACFTAGVDHGQALVFERASVHSELSEPYALGVAFATVTAWTNAGAGRSFQGVSPGNNSTPGFEWTAWVMRGQDDERPEGNYSEFCYGSSMLEAMTNLASWCVAHGAPARDTIPAPPPAVGGSHLVGEPVPQRATSAATDDEPDDEFDAMDGFAAMAPETELDQ